MNTTPYMSILKAKAGELEALSHFLVRRESSGLLPLLDVLPQEYDSESNKKLDDIEFLDKKVKQIREALLVDDEPLLMGLKLKAPKVELFLDNDFWDSNKLLQNQVHPLEYLCRSIAHERLVINPVVGYEKWFYSDDASLYVQAFKNLLKSSCSKICLRVDVDTIKDEAVHEPEEFRENVISILDELEVDPKYCVLLLDFKDVRVISPEEIVDSVSSVTDSLNSIGFGNVFLAGGSAPKFVSDVVERNASGVTPRTEMKAWKKLVNSKFQIGFADYGVRNPEASDSVRNPHINSKLLYTSDEEFYVVRGASLKGLTGCARSEQFIPLVENLVNSKYFSACSNCWGDKEIFNMLYKPTADLTKWVSYSTNRHLCFVLDEVLEYQRQVAAKPSSEKGVIR